MKNKYRFASLFVVDTFRHFGLTEFSYKNSSLFYKFNLKTYYNFPIKQFRKYEGHFYRVRQRAKIETEAACNL